MTYIYTIYTTILVDIGHLRNNGKDRMGRMDKNALLKKRKNIFYYIKFGLVLSTLSFPKKNR